MAAEQSKEAATGRGAVVTGASRGVGAAVARRLAAEHHPLVLVARSRDRLAELADEIARNGGTARAVACDLRQPDDIKRLAREAETFLGGVSILINNAGVAPAGPIGRIGLDMWNETLALNLTAPLLCIQAFSGAMADRGWGRIINIASVAALSGDRYIAAYAASKHALLGLTRCAAAELGDRGITVNAVCPGFVDTELTRAAVARVVDRTGRSEAEALGDMLRTAGQTRLISPQQVADTVAFLCQDAAGGTNGQPIVINEGVVT